MADAVVVGGGLGAVRAAAALRASGRSVVLVQEGGRLAGLTDPGLPVGTGFERFANPPAGWRAVAGLTTGLYVGGRVHALPLSRTILPKLFPVAQMASAAGAWGRSKASGELARLIGGGKEVRTYQDWLTQALGAPVFERMFLPYCERRFGDPAGITANVARGVHGPVAGGGRACPAHGRAAELRSLVGGIEVVYAAVAGLEAGVVRTEVGDVEGEVFVDLPPARVVSLLGAAAPAGLASEVSWLRFRHALEVSLEGGASLPWITHVVDGPGQAYRFVRHGLFPGNGWLQGRVSVQMSVEGNDPLWSGPEADVVASALCALSEVTPGATAEGARVQRVADHNPVWVTTTAARMRRYILALSELKITPVGRAGTYAPLSGDREVAYLNTVIGGGVSVSEALRVHVQPPVVIDEPSAHLTDFANA